jgi:hypothetical protein
MGRAVDREVAMTTEAENPDTISRTSVADRIGGGNDASALLGAVKRCSILKPSVRLANSVGIKKAKTAVVPHCIWVNGTMIHRPATSRPKKRHPCGTAIAIEVRPADLQKPRSSH